MIEHIPELIESGISSLKIEGRAKSAYYCAVTTNAYRHAVNDYMKERENYTLKPWIKEELEKSAIENTTQVFTLAKNLDKLLQTVATLDIMMLWQFVKVMRAMYQISLRETNSLSVIHLMFCHLPVFHLQQFVRN